MNNTSNNSNVYRSGAINVFRAWYDLSNGDELSFSISRIRRKDNLYSDYIGQCSLSKPYSSVFNDYNFSDIIFTTNFYFSPNSSKEKLNDIVKAANEFFTKEFKNIIIDLETILGNNINSNKILFRFSKNKKINI